MAKVKSSDKIRKPMNAALPFRSYVYEILLFVSQNGPCEKSPIYAAIEQTGRTAQDTVNYLIDIGWLDETRMGLHNRKLIDITNDGRVNLLRMKEIVSSINHETVDDLNPGDIGPSPESGTPSIEDR